MPRAYRKSSSYWQNARKPIVVTQSAPAATVATSHEKAPFIDFVPTFDGQTHYSATAACGGGSVNTTSLRDSAAPSIVQTDRYPNIRAGLLPFSTVEGNYSINEAISMCYQAFFNYAVLRNAITLMTDFSISKLHVKTTNKRVKQFIETWFEAIGLNQFMAQFFLEYYRSGNVFIYKFGGKISEDGMNMLKTSYSSAGDTEMEEALAAAPKRPIIPIRYIILNPMQVYLQRGASYAYGYVRMLSTYEIERLKNPQTEEDKQIFKSFPEDIQRQIKQGGAWRYLFVPLDQKRLYYVFYRKQDYEPLAVPMAFPVLNDIEFKLMLRKIDMTLAATMEQVLLVVTAGRPADSDNQATGPKQLQAIQDMFQNQTIGRVLIADYTTKAEWKIPDLKDLLGPAKYERVDKDIKEGLQYMFFGEDKFANASIKARIFIETLREGRRSFLESFLIPEVKKICEAMNFKNVPRLEFEEVQIQDEAIMNRLYVQLAQMGVLDADETFMAMKTGMLPTKEESLVHQEDYKKARTRGLYTPLAPPQAGANGRPGGTGGTPAPRKVSTPIGQSKAGAAFAGAESDVSRDSKYHFGMTRIADSLVKLGDVRASVEKALLKKWGLKSLNDAQSNVAASITKGIVFNEPEETWFSSIARYLRKPIPTSPEVTAELIDIATEFNVDTWQAAILAKSKVDFTPPEAAE